MRREVSRRIGAGLVRGQCRFITLTAPGDVDPATSFRDIQRWWKRLELRIGRRFGPTAHFGVVEAQKRGAAHLHVVIRGPFIPHQWLRRNALAVGFGRAVHVRRPHGGTAAYMTKTFGASSASLPKGTHRVRASRNWDIDPPAVAAVSGEWWIAVGALPNVAESARRSGYAIATTHSGAPPPSSSPRTVRWYRAGWFPRVIGLRSLPRPSLGVVA